MINVIPASKRHFANHGWLKTHLLFSFSEYYDPKNIHHGVIRVFNDDRIDAGKGFGMHPHKDMEIVTIILEGEISHKDSMGNDTTMKKGEVQRMSAGTGVYHSEFNNGSEELHLYQIWILPAKQGITPSYEQKIFDPAKAKNTLMAVVSPEKKDDALSINQDASIYLGYFDAGNSIHYSTDPKRKLLIYLTTGALSVNGQDLNTNDQARISDEGSLEIKAAENTTFIMIDAIAH
jgi:redox-sensitive bicupin YhaK (pirin superfamily)